MLLIHAPSTGRLLNERRPVTLSKLVMIWTEADTRAVRPTADLPLHSSARSNKVTTGIFGIPAVLSLCKYGVKNILLNKNAGSI
jgi:hypothetical protein